MSVNIFYLLFSIPVLAFRSDGAQAPESRENFLGSELLSYATNSEGSSQEEAQEINRSLSHPYSLDGAVAGSLVLAVDELYQATTSGIGKILSFSDCTTPSSLAELTEILSSEFRQDTRLVFYPLGAPRNENTRVILSREILVQSKDREAILRSASEAGLALKSEPSYAPGFFLFTSENPFQSVLGAVRLRSKGFSAQSLPYMAATPLSLPDDPLFPNQWHIRGRGQNGAKKASDARITPAWELRDSSGTLVRGTGVKIGIVDDGVQVDHPDLSNNISATYRRNWNSGTDEDPSPSYPSDNHGTAVAGVAAAVGYNHTGVSGAAPGATIVPLRFIADPFTDADEADMYSYATTNRVVRVKNNSWGVGNYSTALTSFGLGANYSLAGLAIANAAKSGQVILFAAGNGLVQQENVNFRGRQNSIYVLAVGAANDQGRQTDYSTPGAAVVITAPSGGDVYNLPSSRPQGTSTTDRTGENGYNYSGNSSDYADRDYTDSFNGTSSACPVASGITALVLQANPNLTWRDVKEIYIRSATRNDSGDSDWARNGAGFWFNHKYGAGLINAFEAVRLAKSWTPLDAMTNVAVGSGGLSQRIKDNYSAGSVRSFDTRGLVSLRVEHATLTLDISHPSRGELEIQLVSPAGTISRLAEIHTSYTQDPADYPNWTFSTVHHWGEDSRGLWRLKVADRVSGNSGILNSAILTLYGTAK